MMRIRDTKPNTDYPSEKVVLTVSLAVFFAVSFVQQGILKNGMLTDIAPYIALGGYVFCLAVWRASINYRVTQKSARDFLKLAHDVMLCWVLIRFLQTVVLYKDVAIMRESGYFAPVLLMIWSTLGYFVSLCIGKREDHKPAEKYYLLWIPVAFLSALALTDDFHHSVFKVADGEDVNLLFHPNIGFYIILAWIVIFYILKLVNIYRLSRSAGASRYARMIPVIFFIAGIGYAAYHLLGSFLVYTSPVELSIGLYAIDILIWESCIAAGMIPVNSRYGEVFRNSTISLTVTDDEGNEIISSGYADPPGIGDITELMDKGKIERGDHELHMAAIPGGRVIWRSSIKEQKADIGELRKVRTELREKRDIYDLMLAKKSEEVRVSEKTKIFAMLSEAVRGPSDLLESKLDVLEKSGDPVRTLREINIIGSHIKRMGNLHLMKESGDRINVIELALCIREASGLMADMGIECRNEIESDISAGKEMIIAFYDIFMNVIERCGRDIKYIRTGSEVTDECSPALFIDIETDGGSEVFNGANVHSGFDVLCERKGDVQRITVRERRGAV